MSGKRSVKIDWFGDELQKAIDDAKEPALWAAGQILKRDAQANAPTNTGRLKESAFVATSERNDYRKGKRDRKRIPVPAKDGVIVGFGVWYSNLLEDTGAKAHKIPRKNRKILKIEGRYYSSANHSGFKRKPFLAPALEQNKDRIGQEVARVIAGKID